MQPFHAASTPLGGSPASSGSATDPNATARIQIGSVALDIGALLDGSTWLQSRSIGNYATNYACLLNPNGGSVGIGTTNPGVKLEVTGNIRQSSLPVLFVYKTTSQVVGTGTADIVFAGTITNSQWTINGLTDTFTLNGPSGYYLIHTRLQTSTGTYNYLGASIRVNDIDRSTPYVGKTTTASYQIAQCQIVTFLNTNDSISVVGIPSVSVTIDSSTAADARTSLHAVYLSGQ
jgi:hypothetical protein